MGSKEELYRLQDCDRRQAMGCRVQAVELDSAKGGKGIRGGAA